MTLCPIALAASCKKCPIVSMCPLKTVIGDYPKDAGAATKASTSGKSDKRRKR